MNNQSCTVRFLSWILASFFLLSCSHTAPKPEAGSEPIAASRSGNSPQLMDYEVQVLSNGLKIIWIKDAKLPIVSVALAIRSGGSLDPAGHEGLAELTAQVLDKGLPGQNAMAVASRLEQRADSFGASVDADATFVGMQGLSFHALDSLHDLYDLVAHPTFPKAEVERSRQLMLARLSRVTDRPGEFTSMVYEKYLFGSHPYAHDGVGTPAGLAHITRDDVVRFHKRYYSPDRTTMAVVGQFDDAFKAAVVQTFSSWPKSGVAMTAIPTPTEKPGFSILAVEKPQLQQTEIRMGHIGIKRNIPDYLPLKVAAMILGEPGSFKTRLLNEIRIKRALTYSIHATFDPRVEPGAFEISTFTRNEKIHEMVAEMLKVFKTFHDSGVTEAEVASAKSELKGRFPRLIETGDDLAHQLLVLDLNGVPYNYLNTFLQEVDRVTPEQVNAAITNHFRPESLKIVVYGPQGDHSLESLKDFGPVTIEDYRKAL